MHAPSTSFKPLSSASLTPEESKILTWLRSAKWEPQAGSREPIPYKAKVPEFFSGVRLFAMQGGSGSAMGALERLIKKLEYQGILGKQEMHPLGGHGAARFLSLTKAELDNLGVGNAADEDDED